MSVFEVFETIDTIRKTGQPFCVATVVRTADATSAKAGAKAVITADGTILGHLGGACVQSAVRAAAGAALSGGTAQLIRVKPSGDVRSAHDADGIPLYKSGCPSGGTVDLLIEAYRPPPAVVVFGTTAIARGVIAHAKPSGFRVIASRDLSGAASASGFFDGTDIGALGLTETDFIVIASQGNGDAAALKAAFASKAGRITMVASRRKAETLMQRLAESGAGPLDPSRLKSPAGLPIGAMDPEEIAVSIVAELIGWRREATGGGRAER